MRPILARLLIAAVGIAACSDSPAGSPGGNARQWLEQTAVPLAAVTPGSADPDLAAFKTMAGTARIIGLGEATHGSHEFFTMKDRLFRYLVEEHGVTGFAIEATMPEAFALDTYVRTGVGNPAVLLSHLYFWTWNTQEVADLIAGLRAWNVAHPQQQVGFYGFDMQYPGMAIDSVTSYVARVGPDLSATIADDYACLASYRNDTRGRFSLRYGSASASVWQGCTPKVAAAYTHLDENRTALVAASSAREFELALRMARVVVQWEVMARTNSSISRDASMAENVGWLLDREGPNGKLFLWAHNYHIARLTSSMGGVLAERYGADYLPVGFAFGSGGLNAVEGLGNGAFGLLKPFNAPPPLAGSYEETFAQVEAANYYVDLRTPTGDIGGWFSGPHMLRSIGAVYYPQSPQVHYGNALLRQMFDVLIFIETTTPSVLLPFQY